MSSMPTIWVRHTIDTNLLPVIENPDILCELCLGCSGGLLLFCELVFSRLCQAVALAYGDRDFPLSIDLALCLCFGFRSLV
jgi:hypothetical protein